MTSTARTRRRAGRQSAAPGQGNEHEDTTMAGTFYGMARNDMNARMREKADRTHTAGAWQAPADRPAATAAASTGPDSRGGLLARVWQLVARPAARKAEGSSSI
jgi:hypothetical protein